MAILIRGTDITLYTAGGTETVTNVLIGEPSGDGYTLGIPKGDAHDWTDRKIGFFGMLWRTVGEPVQGIEANIPLRWHRKVRVQRLRITGGVTVYAADTFERFFFPEVQITDLRGQRTSKTGTQHDGALTVRLFAACRNPAYCVRPGDLIVPGECPVQFETASEQQVSASMTALRAFAYGTVRSVTTELIGVQPDYIITAG